MSESKAQKAAREKAEAKAAEEAAAAEAKAAEEAAAAEAKAAEEAAAADGDSEAKDADDDADGDGPDSGPLTFSAPPSKAAKEANDRSAYADAAGPRDVFDASPAKARFVNSDGEPLAFEDMFEDGGMSKTFVTTKTRIFEIFVYHNSTTEGRRLTYVAGKRIPRSEAEALRALIEG